MHPVDEVSEDGVKFWSGKRKPPQIPTTAADDGDYLSFVAACAQLYASVHGIDAPSGDEALNSRVVEVLHHFRLFQNLYPKRM